MDELFRRAAENYPLDTSGANWNKVLALMEGETEGKTIAEKKQNNNRRFLWLLLLLPLGFVCNQLYTPGFLSGDTRRGATESESKGAVKQSTTESVKMNSNVSEVQEKQAEGLTVARGTGSPIADDGAKNHDLVSANMQKDKATYDANASRSKKSTRLGQGFLDGEESPGQGVIQTIETEVDASAVPAFYNRTFVYSVPGRSWEPKPNMIAGNGMATPPAIKSSGTAKSNPIRVTKPKRFYAGLMGGLDATTIKLQKVENAGFSYGVLTGYQLNRKWSVEAGAYLERKYYYSDGKYFNTSKIYMPANSRISEVSGNCKMIEVPVSARYLFSSNKGSKWFSTLGLSSYFMTEENYTYDYYYGTVGPVAHSKQYRNGSTNLFSNISLSAGYIRPLGNFADVRIEPYFKLPMSGLGIGSLPLFSMGLQVGVTKKF